MPVQPPVFISAANPSEVASAKMLEVFLGTPTPSRMLIFTGIAMPPGVESEGLLDSYEITIDLNQSITKPILSSAATVGLASIHNEDSDFLFATDDVAVFADTSTGRLQ